MVEGKLLKRGIIYFLVILVIVPSNFFHDPVEAKSINPMEDPIMDQKEKIQLSRVNDRRIIVQLKDNTQLTGNYPIDLQETSHVLKRANYQVVKVNEGNDYQGVLNKIQLDKNVVFAEPDYIKTITHVPSDPLYTNQWYLPNIKMPQAWDIYRGSPSVTIAVLDTGVNAQHPDLAGKILPGYDFVNNDARPSDDHGHGTNIAGIIAGNSDGAGIVGIDHQAKILPLKVLNNEGTGSSLDVVEAVYFAMEQGADVINMSFAAPESTFAEERALRSAFEQGIVLVAAAGNDATNDIVYPASYDFVISVAATGMDNQKAPFSNYGNFIDIAAPGVNLYTTAYQGGYEFVSGTSYSAPIISSLAGMLKGLHPEWSPIDIEWALESSGANMDRSEWNWLTGFGKVNADRVFSQQIPTEEDAPNEESEAKIIYSGITTEKIGRPMDTDWFTFTIGQESNVILSLNNTPKNVDLVGTLLEYKNNELINVYDINLAEIGQNEQLIFQSTGGTYFLEVYDFYSHWSSSPYQIQLQVNSLVPVNIAPKSDVPSGIYVEQIVVKLTRDNYYDSIIYTLDGTEPTLTNGQVYNGPISIDKNTVVKAIAVRGMEVSNTATFTYDIRPEKKITFPDALGNWAEKDIQYLANLDLITGYPDGNFGVKDPISRAEASAILVRELELPLEASTFKDVDKGYWASKYIGAATKAGIFTGYDETSFKPLNPLTREEMAAILVRAYDLTGSATVTFKDVTPTWSQPYIETLIANNITTGFPDNTFRPKSNISRSEFAAMLARVLTTR